MVAELPPVKILLADDDADDRITFSDAFQELKIRNELTMFCNGDDLMNYLRSAVIDIPQLLFLDLNMPRRSGLDCLHEIRKDKRFKNISVAIYSTSSSENEIAKTFAGGANLYIKKPTDYTKLKKIISEVVLNSANPKKRRSRSSYFITV